MSDMALNVIMLGPPGAGKGTQAERVARARGIPRISTGDILREAVQAGTDIGRRVQATMDRGELVSDEVMTGIVRDRLGQADAARGFVLDGFPRTVTQAASLDTIVEGRGPLIIVEIIVPEAELVRRLGSRMICVDCGATAHGFVEPNAGQAGPQVDALRCRRCGGRLVQRSDDDETVVRERLKVYQRQTAPIVEFYRHRPTFRSVDGAQSPDCVTAELVAAIESAHGVTAPTGGGVSR
jgi:adenylate kinase